MRPIEKTAIEKTAERIEKKKTNEQINKKE